MLSVGGVEEGDGVRDEGVHAVDGDELFGEGVRSAEVVDARARDAADGFAGLGDATEHFGKGFADNSPPVCVHANFQGGMSKDGWRPFDSVDFGHESAVDEPGFVEDLVTAPIGVCTAHRVTNGVVLFCEEGMQHFHAYPPVVVESSKRVSVSVAGEELLAAIFGEQQLAVVVHVSQSRGYSFTRSIDLRTVPPGGIGVLVSWRLDVGWV